MTRHSVVEKVFAVVKARRSSGEACATQGVSLFPLDPVSEGVDWGELLASVSRIGPCSLFLPWWIDWKLVEETLGL